jgi:hypothetical protein
LSHFSRQLITLKQWFSARVIFVLQGTSDHVHRHFFCSKWGMVLWAFSGESLAYRIVFQEQRPHTSQVWRPSWVLVAHTCNPSYSGGRDQEDHGLNKANLSK